MAHHLEQPNDISYDIYLCRPLLDISNGGTKLTDDDSMQQRQQLYLQRQ